MDKNKIKKSVLAKNIKQGESTMHNYLNGATLPSSDFLEVVVNLTGCNGHWLLTGEGEAFLPSHTVKEDTHIYISSPSNVNKGTLVGNLTQSMTTGDCEARLAAALIEVGYLKQQVADKELQVASLQRELGRADAMITILQNNHQ